MKSIPKTHWREVWCKRFLLFVLIFLFLIFSFISASFWPDDQDGINFLLGAEFYDLLFHRPHFPGYPVYITLSQVFIKLAKSPETGFVLLSIFSATVCLILNFLFIENVIGQTSALLTTFTLSVHPIFFEFSHKIFSEMPALALIFLAIFLINNLQKAPSKRWFFGMTLLGVMLGIRLSWWPYPFFYLLFGIYHKKGKYAFMGLVMGIFLWLLPLFEYVGVWNFFKIGFVFTQGHFTQWGGAIGNSLSLNHRFFYFLERMGEVFGWYDPGFFLTRIPWIIFTSYCFKKIIFYEKKINDPIRIYVLVSFAYLVWAALGQNVQKARHFIPIIPAVLFLIAYFLEKNLKIFGVIFIFFLTLPLNYFFRENYFPPAAQLKVWIDSLPDKDSAFYCGNTERFFDRYSPKSKIVKVSRMKALSKSIQSTWPKPETIYVCSDINGFVSRGKKPVVQFPARYGDPVGRNLEIYQWE